MAVGRRRRCAAGLACPTTATTREVSRLARPNYSYQKRQKELAKQKKKEEKRLRKLKRKEDADQDPLVETDDQSEPEDSADPSA